MSGLFGICGAPAGQPAGAIAEAMGRRMLHLPQLRARSAEVAPQVAIGHIGIGIFNCGPQPLRSADGQVALCLVGEFYHQQGLRRELERAGALAPGADDAALALAVYARDGAAGLTRLDGAFVVAVWDGRRQELSLVNDRFGLYPHFYTHQGGGMAFSPELKALKAIPGLTLRPSEAAIAQYIRFQHQIGTHTWFTGVHLLPGASLLRYRPDEDRLDLERYWDWEQIPERPAVGFDEAVEETIRRFQRAIDAMSEPPHRPGVYLSGGLDSRTILGFLDRRPNIETVTFGDANCRDVRYAAALARRAGVKHHWLPMQDGHWVREVADLHMAITEGQHSWVHTHCMSTIGAARQWMDVNLSGWDGGSIFGNWIESYAKDWRYRDAPSQADLLGAFYEALCQHFTWPGLTDPEAGALVSPAYRHLNTLAYESLRAEIAQVGGYPPGRRADFFMIDHVDRRHYQQQIVITRAEVEVRCPFFDYGVIDWIFSLPTAVRATPTFYHSLITRRMPRLALVPNQAYDRLPHTNPLIYHGHALIKRGQGWINRKIAPIFPSYPQLYADYENYLRRELRDWGEAILFSPQAQERGWYNPAALRGLWDRHQSGQELWTIGKIAPLISLELVARALFD